jgi:hypothetical protein
MRQKEEQAAREEKRLEQEQQLEFERRRAVITNEAHRQRFEDEVEHYLKPLKVWMRNRHHKFVITPHRSKVYASQQLFRPRRVTQHTTSRLIQGMGQLCLTCTCSLPAPAPVDTAVTGG